MDEKLKVIAGSTLLIMFLLLLSILVSIYIFLKLNSYLPSSNLSFLYSQTLGLVFVTTGYLLISGSWKTILNKTISIPKGYFYEILGLIGGVLIGGLIIMNIGYDANTTDQAGFMLVKTHYFITIAIIITFSIVEEVIFRGTFQRLLRSKTSMYFSIIYPNVLFALTHIPALGSFELKPILALFLLGCVFGYLYERTNSLLAPIVLHVSYNFIVLTTFFLSTT